MVSRFMTRTRCFLYGKLRRTDFLPVGEDRDDDVFERGCDSVDSDEEDHAEYMYSMREVDEPVSDSLPEIGEDDGNALHDLC